MTPKEILIAAKSKIDSPEKLCKGCYARNAEGYPAQISDGTGVKFCPLGAIRQTVYDNH